MLSLRYRVNSFNNNNDLDSDVASQIIGGGGGTCEKQRYKKMHVYVLFFRGRRKTFISGEENVYSKFLLQVSFFK